MEQYPMELTDRMKVLEKRSNELVIEKEVLCKAMERLTAATDEYLERAYPELMQESD